MKRSVILALLLPILGLLATAPAPALAALKGSGDVVKAVPRQKTLAATRGQLVTFDVTLAIAPKWHLYAHGDTNFIGVDLVPHESFPLEEFDAAYPKGEPGEFFGEKVMMIEGNQVIKAEARVPETLAAGVHKVKLGVTVQACDDKVCLAPASLPVELELTVK